MFLSQEEEAEKWANLSKGRLPMTTQYQGEVKEGAQETMELGSDLGGKPRANKSQSSGALQSRSLLQGI